MASYSRILRGTTSALFLAAAFLATGCGDEDLAAVDNEDNQVGMGLPPVDADEEAMPEGDASLLKPCGTPTPTAEEMAANDAVVEQFRADMKARAAEKQGSPSSFVVQSGTIVVFVHVINKGPTVEEGNITDNKIYKQIVALSQAYYNVTGWQFYGYETDRTTNPAWYAAWPGSTAEADMKNALHRGTESALNLYITQPSNGVVGWATRPEQYYYNPMMDGVVINNQTLPSNSTTNAYNQGKVAVHEVGHWLGLYHTFENGCGNPGDYVSDTPASKSPTYGCPASRDSCSSSGTDPFHNYMDYTDDACMWEFTWGQDARIDEQWTIWRY
ncbi:MAG TPA: zinc metalloprotease [Polyangium sp.]|nr:zinc metalloprotease [Polyangium sp.]